MDKESLVGLFKEWETKWGEYVRERTNTTEGKKYYTHQRLWSAYRSLARNMEVLWTWYDYPDLGLPNTNNAMEGLNSSIKGKLNRHKGISAERRKLLITEVIKTHNPQRHK